MCTNSAISGQGWIRTLPNTRICHFSCAWEIHVLAVSLFWQIPIAALHYMSTVQIHCNSNLASNAAVFHCFFKCSKICFMTLLHWFDYVYVFIINTLTITRLSIYKKRNESSIKQSNLIGLSLGQPLTIHRLHCEYCLFTLTRQSRSNCLLFDTLSLSGPVKEPHKNAFTNNVARYMQQYHWNCFRREVSGSHDGTGAMISM